MEKIMHELSNPQKNIWTMEQFYRGSNINNIYGTVTIKQEVDLEKLNTAINKSVQNNKSFGLNFDIKDGQIKQYFVEQEDEDYQKIYLKNYNEVKELAIKISEQVFDIEGKKLYKFVLFKLENGNGGFIVMAHHIISDAATFGLIVTEIIKNYAKILKNEEIEEKNYSYEDYLQDERDYMNSEKFLRDEEYWNNLYTTVPEVASIPSSKANNHITLSGKSKREEYVIEKEQLNKIGEFCKKNRISNFNFFMAIYAIYLSRVSNLNDFVIGTPVLNRTNFKEKQTTGMFINTEPLRIKIEDDVKFIDFVKNIAQNSLSMLRYQKYPYEMLLENLRKKQSNLPALFDIMLSYQITKANDRNIEIPYEIEWLPTSTISNSMYIHLHDNNDDESLNIAYDYQVEKYDKQDIEAMHKRILHIISQVLENENCLEQDIEIVTEEEKNKILNEFNDTKVDYPRNKTIVDLFEEQVEKNPNNIAVVCGEKKLTYRELNEKANSLAQKLSNNKIKVGETVAIRLERSADMVVSIFGCVKAGTTYTLIEKTLPNERIQYILKDSDSRAIITSKGLDKEELNIKAIFLDKAYDSDNEININKNSNIGINKDNNINERLCIIYTSGSTGNPKGVMLTQRGFINLVFAMNDAMNLKICNKFIAHASVSFDMFAFELYCSILNGKTLYLTDDIEQKDPIAISDIITKNNIDFMLTTPSKIESILSNGKLSESLSHIKVFLLGGEVFTSSLYNRMREKTKGNIYNGYGPTEITACCSIKKIESGSSINIGKPVNNAQIYILDTNLSLCPIGIIGELCVAGEGIAEGYINNKERTDKAFVKVKSINKNVYRTGDLARLDDNGEIEYIGRNDFQVKLHGQRIELGEIEKKILGIKEINNACVCIKQVQDRDILTAYYTGNKRIDRKEIIKVIEKELPEYMIPAYFLQLDELPLTMNGKIDRKRLPNPILQSKQKFIKPKNKIEQELLKIFKSLLKMNKISTTDNFFELGGDSLLAINLTTYIYEKMKIRINIKTIFENPTIIELSDIISSMERKIEDNQKIVKSGEREYYPTSSAQRRMYYSSLIDGKDSILYNISGGLILDEIPDVEKLNKCFKKIIERNEALRTYFDIEDNQVVQKILEKSEFNIETEKAKNSDIEEITKKFIKPFDLSKAPLIRAKLVELKNGKGLLLMDMHHIIGDGATLEILTKQISDLYNGNKIKDNQIDYKDFSVWEINNINSPKYRKAENYWLSQFEDDIPVLELPTNYTRPAIQSFEGSEILTTLNEDITSKINEICKENNITPFMLLISIYYVLLSIYCRTEDIVIGTPISGRYNEQTLNIIGMFVNTLALRSKIDNKETFKEFVNQVKQQVLTSFEYQNYPLDELIKKLGIQRDTSRSLLFDVMFIYQNNSYPKLELGGINAKYYIPKTQIAKFDLSLEAIPDEGQMRLRFEYCTKLFTEEFIQSFSEHYINILKNVLENIDVKISDIDILSKKEKKKILQEFNDTKREYPKDKNIVELFEEQVNKNKNKTALVFEETRLTYSELNKKSNQLANYMLENYKLSKQDVVGIFIDKSVESIIAILGIIKAGCVFVPIDTEYPVERINYILEDAKAKIVLTKEEYKDSLETEVPKVYIDLTNSIYKENSEDNPICTTEPEDLIYMMYTSGSTGKPKGVMVTHQNVVRLVKNTNYIEFTENERILQTGSIVFDACTFEIWGAFLNGGTLYLIRKQNMLEQNYFEKYLKDNKITSIFLTTALFNQYCEASNIIFGDLKTLLTGGEAVSIKHMQLALENFPKLNLVHVYGPTENTTFSTYHVVRKEDDGTIPIGKAIANSTTYVVSKNEKLLPVGIPGELWVGGDGVGKGYLNREDLTKEKFIDNPFGEGKVYKTGDLVRLLPDGDIEFIGRIDNQVKIRGFRIELNEIDNVIHEYPYISKTYTIVKSIDDKKYIVNYFTADRTLNTEDINLYLQEKLPFYMVPQFLIQLEEFPLTINGKIDKNKLPVPELETLHEYVPPENEVQEQLCKIWSKLFEMKKVSILDNFFELGGDSLTAIKFQTEALKLDININYSDIFEYPTIKALSEKKQDKQLYEVDKDYDYSEINKLLELNTIENIESKSEEIKCGNLLLCGATGFLGAHILDKYLSNTDGNIYCMVRRKENMDSAIRLKNVLNFYFEDKYDKYFGNRINVVYGDITLDNFGLNEKEYKQLGKNIDIVVNSAALVKHFGDFKMFQSINVIGTRNIVKFCKDFNKKLYHISTMSVAGINTPDEKVNNDQERILFNETNFFVGQNLNNAYVYTKFEAEKGIFEEIPNGLQACILRMGNISSRVSDGKFQMNVSENAFINRIKSLLNIKVIQNRFLNHAIEFTPVDASAEAIIKVISNNPKFTVLHTFNTKVINIPDILVILESLGYIIEAVDDKKFASRIREFLKDDKLKNKISGLIPDLNSDKTLALLSRTLQNGYFTTLYLNSIGYEWPEIDKDYIMKYMGYFKKIGYIE